MIRIQIPAPPPALSFTDRSSTIFELIVLNKLADKETKINGYAFHQRLQSEGHRFCNEELRTFMRENSACLPDLLASVKGILCVFPENGFSEVDILSWQYDSWKVSSRPMRSEEFSKWHYALMIKRIS